MPTLELAKPDAISATPKAIAALVPAIDSKPACASSSVLTVVDPLSTKGLEWDATVVLDPDAIVEESPGGVRVLYVVLTRAAHRMTVLRPG